MQNNTLITGEVIFAISVFSSVIGLLIYPSVISIKLTKLSELPEDK